MSGKILHMQNLTHPEFMELDRERTVVMFAVSPIEVHGVHLPMNTDPFLAEAVLVDSAKTALEKLPGYDVLVAPTLPVGADTLPLPGSVEVRPRVVRDLVADVGVSFAQNGFENIGVISSHGGPRHNAAIELACGKVMKKYPKTRMFSPTGELILWVLLGGFNDDLQKKCKGVLPDEELGQLWPSDIHAGALETSLALCFMPEHVREEHKELSPVVFGRGDSFKHRTVRFVARTLGKLLAAFARTEQDKATWNLFADNLAETLILWHFASQPLPSHSGFPHLASTELGKGYLEMVADRGAEMVRDVALGNRDVKDTFTVLSKSWIMRMAVYL